MPSLLTTLDIAAIQRLLNGTDSYTQTSTFLLNPKSVKHTIEISNGNNKTTIGAKSIASPSVSATAVYGNSVATNNLLVGHTNDSNGIKHISCGTVTCSGALRHR